MSLKSIMHVGFCLLLFTLAASHARADIQFAASRVVFDAASREQSFLIANRNDYPVLIQTWIDDGALNSTASDFKGSPVITYPAVFKLAAKENRSIRLINTAINQKTFDKERLYWLNMQIISPRSGKSSDGDRPELNVSILMKFKLFYRPHTLTGPVSSAVKAMQFSRVDADSLRIRNVTPYYVTFRRIAAGNTTLLQDIMLAPDDEQTFRTPVPLNNTFSSLDYTLLDDSGLAVEGNVPLTR